MATAAASTSISAAVAQLKQSRKVNDDREVDLSLPIDSVRESITKLNHLLYYTQLPHRQKMDVMWYLCLLKNMGVDLEEMNSINRIDHYSEKEQALKPLLEKVWNKELQHDDFMRAVEPLKDYAIDIAMIIELPKVGLEEFVEKHASTSSPDVESILDYLWDNRCLGKIGFSNVAELATTIMHLPVSYKKQQEWITNLHFLLLRSS